LYAKAYDLDIVRFMPFFWIGTLKTGDVASDLARRIVAIERGALPRLLVGRTDTVRDIIDVSDGVAALLLLVEKGASATVYNICRGEGVTIGELIEAFRACAKTEIPVELDPSLMRPVDELVRIGDPTRLRALGWQPVVPLADSVDHILDYWRGQPS
jgi:GDP-4-dehydro-6-deoxy-D-mannose reductase